MRKILYLFLCVSAVSFVSCSSVNRYYRTTTSTTLEPNYHNLMVMPSVADLDISETRISYTESEAYRNMPELANSAASFFSFGRDVKLRCYNIALYNAAIANNADVIVAPNYSIEVDVAGNLSITVTGYPANYRNFRRPTTDDVLLIYRSWKAIELQPTFTELDRERTESTPTVVAPTTTEPLPNPITQPNRKSSNRR